MKATFEIVIRDEDGDIVGELDSYPVNLGDQINGFLTAREFLERLNILRVCGIFWVLGLHPQDSFAIA